MIKQVMCAVVLSLMATAAYPQIFQTDEQQRTSDLRAIKRQGMTMQEQFDETAMDKIKLKAYTDFMNSEMVSRGLAPLSSPEENAPVPVYQVAPDNGTKPYLKICQNRRDGMTECKVWEGRSGKLVRR